MDFEYKWEKAIKNTKIIKKRLRSLETFSSTSLPFIFLSEPKFRKGTTAIRKGKVVINKPVLFLPDNNPTFDGFEINPDELRTFFLLRGIRFPSMQFSQHSSLSISKKNLDKNIESHLIKLEKDEDILTSLITGPYDTWQLSILFYTASLIIKNTPKDIQNIIKKMSEDK